jgi:intein/homing endonuclease
MKKFITKRDGVIENYNLNKIRNVLIKAFDNTNTKCNNLDEIINYINEELFKKDTDNYNIEEIQDLVEKTLMLYQYFDTAKHYINYRAEHNKNRDCSSYLAKIPNDIKTPWGMLGYITYKRTYARTINDDGETEEFRDTILRVLDGCQKQLKVNFTNEELKLAYKYLMELKCSVAGRFLWQLGTETIDKLGIMSLQNCAFVNIDEPIRPFLWIFDVLMLGTGVGFNIQKENIDKLPPVLDVDISIVRKDTKDADFIVPDSREGWVSLLEMVLESYFYKGKSMTYSTLLIRSAGTKIKGFGGVASGPEDLVKGIKLIQGILNNRKGQKITSVDCLDIVNIIASIVVAGNVRRCLPKGSKVHTKLGIINIEDIVISDEVLTSKGYRKVKNVFNQGTQQLLKINTHNGDFKCTKNHKMMVYKDNNYEWITAENLNIGDMLIITKTPVEGNSHMKLPSFKFDSSNNRVCCPEYTPDISWFFGFISNNCIFDDISYSITINCYSMELLKKIQKIIDKLGNPFKIITEIDVHNNTYKIVIVSLNFYKYITTNFIGKIPYFINETTYYNRLAYIIGIFESNMTIINEHEIIIDKIANYNYSNELSHLLYSCGIEHYKNNNIITINNYQAINVFKNYQLLKLYNKTYPKTNDFNETKPIIYNNCIISLSEIQEITLDNYEDTYDIEVEEVHEFFCNGFLTHNSALICLGDYDDIDYLNAKRWDLGNIPNWRCMSNNSIVCNDISKLPEEFWNGYNGNGEPYGLINIDLSRKIGRIKDGDKYPDPDVAGYNPCAEQSLANYETCCLSEIFLPNVSSYEELKEIAIIVYRICKHSLLLKCHQKMTENIVHKNLRMGIGITGYLQSSEEKKGWLNDLYEFIREYDINYSNKLGVSTSVKLTTIKPSGTLSLLAGVTSGAHPAIYQYFIRRIRISSSNNHLIELARSHNYKIEYQLNFDGTEDKNTMIIEFPCCYPEGTILAKDMSAIDQLNTIKELQTNWSDNSVSVTIYYRLHELDDIKKWLNDNYNNNIKSCSFLLHNDHGFKQAPFEEISKEKYDKLMKRVIPITSGKILTSAENELMSDCAGGACPIR